MKWVAYADALAIPFFALLVWTMATKSNRTWNETVLYAFGVVGFLADTVFTIQNGMRSR
jgi:hypothetical protein